MAYVNTSVGTANTDLDDFVPQLWAEGINNYIEEQFVLANIVDTSLSALVKQRGDVVHIPLMTEKSATATTPAAFSAITDNLTYHSNNDDEKTITVDKLYYSAQIISDIANVQASPEFFDMYVKGMGYAIGRKVEALIADDITGLTVGNTVQLDLSANNTFAAADMGNVLKVMAQNNFDPTDGWAMVVSPTLYGSMMQITNFTSADFSGSGGLAVKGGRGLVGTLAGMPVYVSNRMKETTTNDHIAGAIFQPENAKLLYQIEPKVVSEYSVDFLGTKVAAYTACGFDFVKDGEIITLTNLGG
tara:strand:- start:427 stop:1332 length:906 start_codon:yes stop_codon:yes gene_type:complete